MSRAGVFLPQASPEQRKSLTRAAGPILRDMVAELPTSEFEMLKNQVLYFDLDKSGFDTKEGSLEIWTGSYSFNQGVSGFSESCSPLQWQQLAAKCGDKIVAYSGVYMYNYSCPAETQQPSTLGFFRDSLLFALLEPYYQVFSD